jgi:hypothetical protein
VFGSPPPRALTWAAGVLRRQIRFPEIVFVITSVESDPGNVEGFAALFYETITLPPTVVRMTPSQSPRQP